MKLTLRLRRGFYGDDVEISCLDRESLVNMFEECDVDQLNVSIVGTQNLSIVSYISNATEARKYTVSYREYEHYFIDTFSAKQAVDLLFCSAGDLGLLER